jgi:hypothetical protein
MFRSENLCHPLPSLLKYIYYSSRERNIFFTLDVPVFPKLFGDVAVPDPFRVFSDPDPHKYPSLMSTAKLTERENLTKYPFWLGPGGPTEKENQVLKQ